MSVKERVADLQQRCVHFNGMMNETCKAGVCYKDVRLDHEPIPYKDRWGHQYESRASHPCLGKYNHGGAVCMKREVLSVEEATKQAEVQQAETQLFLEGLIRCTKDAGGRRGIAGVVECPKCNGKLHYTVASENGHLWGKCETKDCLAWMM